MILTNIGSVPGKKIVEHFGIVQGSTVRAKHLGRDMMAGLKNLVGGELKGYTELVQHHIIVHGSTCRDANDKTTTHRATSKRKTTKLPFR